MKKTLFTKISLILAAAVCFAATATVAPCPGWAEPADESEWTSMPEGGKAAFVGVQGGTVPASVYYNEDGSELTTQAGLGSNDFLEAVQGEAGALSAENLIPFGVLEEVSASGNLASRGVNELPRILPQGVGKIYEQDFENDTLLLTSELTRI